MEKKNLFFLVIRIIGQAKNNNYQLKANELKIKCFMLC